MLKGKTRTGHLNKIGTTMIEKEDSEFSYRYPIMVRIETVEDITADLETAAEKLGWSVQKLVNCVNKGFQSYIESAARSTRSSELRKQYGIAGASTGENETEIEDF